MATKQTATPLASDAPAREDKLDFQPYTDTLTDIIRDPDTEGPLVIGLFGSWGCGKTSLMQFVKDDLEKAGDGTGRRCRCVWFDAWKYEKEDALWRALLLRVVDQLRDRDAKGEDPTREERRKSIERLEQRLYRDVKWQEKGGLTVDGSKLLKGAVKGALQMTFGFVPGLAALIKAMEAAQGKLGEGEAVGEMIEAFQREVVAHHQTQLRSIEEFQREFGLLVAEHILNRAERLVVFVDDLDRCLPEKAVEVLEAIKLFLDVKGCIFLLGLDEQVITSGIRVKYRQSATDDGAGTSQRIPIDGTAYLEKIIQLPFRLPRIQPEDMLRYVQSQASGMDSRCSEVFARGLEANPRKVKRAINIFLFISRLAGKRNLDIRSVRLAKVVVIYHSHPVLYQFLQQKPADLPDLERWLRADRAAGSRDALPSGAPAAGPGAEPPPAPDAARLLTPELRQVLLLFKDDPEACFLDIAYAELARYFTLTQGTIVEPSLPAAATPAPALEFPAPTFVSIPAGEFLMGTSDQDIEQLCQAHEWAREWRKEGWFKAEQPQHPIELDEYRIGKYPVTNAEYEAFLKATPRPPPQHWTAGAVPSELSAHPVVNVTWADAVAYCEWLTERLREAGRLGAREVIRLPTEAEWEKAARGDKGHWYPWGNDWDPQKCNTVEGGGGGSSPAGKYSPAGDSPYGVADMAGNVWEWCRDCFAEDYYRSSPTRNPTGPGAGELRVLRGGSWYHAASRARCAARTRDYPGARSDYLGFRVVASPLATSGL